MTEVKIKRFPGPALYKFDLTDEQFQEIFKSFAPPAELAYQYSVTEELVRLIQSGEHWRQVAARADEFEKWHSDWERSWVDSEPEEKVKPLSKEQVVVLLKSQGASISEIARQVGISRPTIYKILGKESKEPDSLNKPVKLKPIGDVNKELQMLREQELTENLES